MREAGHRAVDQRRVLLRRRLGADAEAVHDAGPEVLDHHVGAVDQALRDLEVAGRLEVEGDASLAALEEGVGRMLPARAARRVDVDDVGALVGEHDAGQRAGDVLAEIDNADTGEWTCHDEYPCLPSSSNRLALLRPTLTHP